MAENDSASSSDSCSRVGHYTIIRSLGRGGMGEVFLAHDTKLDRMVALKLLSAEFASDVRRLRRFETEARTLAALNHPHIVAVFSVEDTEGRYGLVMEFVDGKTLREFISPAGISIGRFLEIALQLTDAMSAAHDRGITHRDLKPENVMLTQTGSVKILDFGLAKVRSGFPQSDVDWTMASSAATAQGTILGTLPYMSPEQAAGEPLDHRSDLFSLGVVFYELLTGSRPFEGRTVGRLVSSILRDVPPLVSVARPDVPHELAAIVRRCLEKDPGHRFQSALDLRNAISALSAPSRPVKTEVPSQPSSMSVAEGHARADRNPMTLVFNTRLGLTLCLACLFVVNWVETTLESPLPRAAGAGPQFNSGLMHAFNWFEGGLSFERHDLTNATAIYAGSIAYFFLPLLMFAATMVMLLRRTSIDAYRVFALTIATTYLMSVGFFLFLPIPERWAFPDSQAILLSDLWSTRLIEAIRPISALDNCFPSFHVSGTFDIVLIWYLLQERFRLSMAFLGAAVALSTVLLGIHWFADVVAGLALAVVSLGIALRVNEMLKRRVEPLQDGNLKCPHCGSRLEEPGPCPVCLFQMGLGDSVDAPR